MYNYTFTSRNLLAMREVCAFLMDVPQPTEGFQLHYRKNFAPQAQLQDQASATAGL